MFTMYRYVTGVLDKVPNTFSFVLQNQTIKKSKQNKTMGFVEDHHTWWPGPTVSLLRDE